VEKLVSFFNSLEFDNPQYFWLGGIIMLLLIFLPRIFVKRGLAIDLEFWKPLLPLKNKRMLVFSVPVVLITLFLALTLINPQLISRSSSVVIGKPVMLVIDISGSTVGASELHPEMTGQEAARYTFENLISLRSDISFGLILYSSQNFIARYFTYKNELFVDTLDNEKAIYRLNRETNTAAALAKAREFLTDNIYGEDKAIVLISDLLLTYEDLVESLEEIDKNIAAGIDVYVVSTTGQEGYMYRFPAREGLTVLDIYDTESVALMYEKLTAMQASPISLKESLYRKNLLPYIIPCILAVSLIVFIISETRFRKIP